MARRRARRTTPRRVADRYPEAWDMLMFGMRLGADPRTVVTTTPRPAKLIRDLVRDPICVVTRGTSYENRGNTSGRPATRTPTPGSPISFPGGSTR